MRLCSLCKSLRGNGKLFSLAKSQAGCFICQGELYGRAEKALRNAMNKAESLEFKTFQMGCRVPDEVLAREELAWERGGAVGASSVKTLLNRRLSKIFSERFKAEADPFDPHLKVLVDACLGEAHFEPQPLFIAGKYRKLSREIAQSIWHCKTCMGKGCTKCGGKGKMYESVEELAGAFFLKAAEGERTKFHATGREDVDARMLGEGRLFAIEIVKPRKRFFDLGALEAAVDMANAGKVEVRGLFLAGKKFMEMLHNGRPDKQYRALAEIQGGLSDEDLKLLRPVHMRQKTPLRVLHRRSDLERLRWIKKISVERKWGELAEIEVKAEAGAYIKEFVSGDEGRTVPSVSGLLRKKSRAVELDVVWIERVAEDWW